MKIKKGDNVVVVAGKSKGTTGKVEKVFPATNRVIVGGANKVNRRFKPKKRGEKGEVKQVEAALHLSNVRLVESGIAVRVGAKMEGDKKVRISKKTGKTI
jgi:large subunit ribosomal protein L24